MIHRAAAVLATIVATAALLWADPTAAPAEATTDHYVAPATASIEPAVIEAGERSTITFTPGFFLPAEKVAVEVAGARAANALVSLPGRSDERLVSRADGSMIAVFTAPERGAGRYTLTFTASRDYVAVITVVQPEQRRRNAPDHGFFPPGAGLPDPGANGALEDDGSGGDGIDRPPPIDPGAPRPPGGVDIPGASPETPDWPRLDEIPWGIILLGGITLVAGTVVTTLTIAARRRS